MFTQMLAVITSLTSDKLFRLVDIDHRGVERSKAADKEGETSSAVISSLPPWDILTPREGAL
jgi:hypothetical protein